MVLPCERERQGITGDVPVELHGLVGLFAPAVALVGVVGSCPDAAAGFEVAWAEIGDVDPVAASGGVFDLPAGLVDSESPKPGGSLACLRLRVLARPAGRIESGRCGLGRQDAATLAAVTMRPSVATARTAKRCTPGVSQEVTR